MLAAWLDRVSACHCPDRIYFVDGGRTKLEAYLQDFPTPLDATHLNLFTLDGLAAKSFNDVIFWPAQKPRFRIWEIVVIYTERETKKLRK